MSKALKPNAYIRTRNKKKTAYPTIPLKTAAIALIINATEE